MRGARRGRRAPSPGCAEAAAAGREPGVGGRDRWRAPRARGAHRADLRARPAGGHDRHRARPGRRGDRRTGAGAAVEYGDRRDREHPDRPAVLPPAPRSPRGGAQARDARRGRVDRDPRDGGASRPRDPIAFGGRSRPSPQSGGPGESAAGGDGAGAGDMLRDAAQAGVDLIDWAVETGGAMIDAVAGFLGVDREVVDAGDVQQPAVVVDVPKETTPPAESAAPAHQRGDAYKNQRDNKSAHVAGDVSCSPTSFTMALIDLHGGDEEAVRAALDRADQAARREDGRRPDRGTGHRATADRRLAGGDGGEAARTSGARRSGRRGRRSSTAGTTTRIPTPSSTSPRSTARRPEKRPRRTPTPTPGTRGRR